MKFSSNRDKPEFIANILLFILVIFFDIGIWTFFSPCAIKEDGSFMTCHWAGVATGMTALLLTVHIIIFLFVKNKKVKTGILLTMLPTALLMLLFPGVLIPLCMMSSMRCIMIMRPAVYVLGILIIALIIINFALNKRGEKRDNTAK